MRCFCFENELETVRNRRKIARCARRFMRPSKVEMATSHTEVVQLLAARPKSDFGTPGTVPRSIADEKAGVTIDG
jgi:hypothetical protein